MKHILYTGHFLLMRHVLIAAAVTILLIALGIIAMGERSARPIFQPNAISATYDLAR